MDQQATPKENEITNQAPKPNRKDPKVRIEKNLRNIQNPNCIILYPHIRDMHLLAQMLFTFDTVVNRMRMIAGLYMTLEEFRENMKKVVALAERVDDFIKTLGGNSYYLSGAISDSAEQRQIMAQNEHAHTFIPKTQEAERIAKLFKSLDSAFCEFKVKVQITEIDKLGDVLAKMKQLVHDFHDLTTEFAKLTRINYTPPQGLNGYLGKNVGERPGNGKRTPKEKKA